MNTDKRKIDIFKKENVGDIYYDKPLCLYSNWNIGGKADLLIEPYNGEQVATAITIAKEQQVPLVVIGDGTNLLFSDEGVRGVVLKIGRNLGKYTVNGNEITAQSGVWVPILARASACAGLSGLEHAVGIPGTLGGLVWMNGGSMRRGIGENIQSVSLVDSAGRKMHLLKEQCCFTYRKSIFQKMDSIIVEAKLELEFGVPKTIKSEMLRILRQRRKKFPLKMHNCGSVFVSGGELYERFGPPGKIIEKLGLKGFRVGDAQVSSTHANFFVNLGKSNAIEMLKLINIVRRQVYERTKIKMDCEVRYISPEGLVIPAHTASEQIIGSIKSPIYG